MDLERPSSGSCEGLRKRCDEKWHYRWKGHGKKKIKSNLIAHWQNTTRSGSACTSTMWYGRYRKAHRIRARQSIGTLPAYVRSVEGWGSLYIIANTGIVRAIGFMNVGAIVFSELIAHVERKHWNAVNLDIVSDNWTPLSCNYIDILRVSREYRSFQWKNNLTSLRDNSVLENTIRDNWICDCVSQLFLTTKS